MQEATEKRDKSEVGVGTVLDTLPVAALFLEGETVRINRAAEELTGYQKHEIAYDKGWFSNLYRKSISTPTGADSAPSRHRELMVRKDGSLRLVECLAEPAAAPIILLHDITSPRGAGEAAAPPEPPPPPETVPAALLDMVCTISFDGRFQSAYGRWEEILGYPLGEMVDRPFTDFIHPNDVESTLRALELLVQNMPVPGICNRLRCKDDSYRWMEWKFLSQEGVPHVFAALRDVTTQKELEQTLRSREQLYRGLFHNAPVGIYQSDADGRHFIANQRWYEYAGISTQEAYPQGLGFSVREEDRERISTMWKNALESGKEWSSEYSYRTEDGRRVWIHGTALQLLDEDGQVIGYLGCNIDITERKLAEEAIRRLNGELDQRVMERTMQLKLAKEEMESFSYSVSHDLRAPLRHINSYCTILAEDFAAELPLNAHHYLDRICAASTRMGRLIDDLLKLSRINRAEMKQGQFKISKVAQEVADALRETYTGREVEFVISKGLIARGDRFLVRQVLENLLENAMKYTSRRATARIEFGKTLIDGSQLFFVKDNGAGFEMAYADKLFQPFQRLHGAEFEGTGIGLATVKRIVERHGGKVWAEGVVGEGATFYFTLSGSVGARTESATASSLRHKPA